MNEERRKYDLEERFVAFAVAVLDVAEALPDTKTGNYIAGQLIRSGSSPALNYGEAQSAESRKDFIHKMRIVGKELKETRVCLRIIILKKQIASELVSSVYTECEELVRICAKSIQTAEDGLSKITD